jgi:hypothetical protein
MTVNLTPAQAAKLGITVPGKKKTRTTRREVRGEPYFTICKTCGLEFRTVASEDRHLRETHHPRYQILIGT